MFYTVQEIAAMLKLSVSQCYALIDDGLLKAHRFTRKKTGALRISQAQLDAYLASTLQQEEEVPLEVQPIPRKKASGGGIDLW